MKSVLVTVVVATLATIPANAASYPVLQCINEKADKNECSDEKLAAVNAVLPWFRPYLSNRRLLDCSHFCDEDLPYFSMHLPCDCKTRRLMELQQSQLRRLQSSTTIPQGPIQVLSEHIATIKNRRCHDVIQQTECFVNFVDHYKNETTETYQFDASKQEAATEGFTTVEEDRYDPITGKFVPAQSIRVGGEEVYDPATGQFVPADSERGNVVEETKYDPVTGKFVPAGGSSGGTVVQENKYDPATGKFVPANSGTSSSSGSNGAGSDSGNGGNVGQTQVYDPATGQFVPAKGGGSGSSGTGSGTNVGQTEVYDPATGQFVPANGGGSGSSGSSNGSGQEYFSNVGQQEVYDPSTGQFVSANATGSSGSGNGSNTLENDVYDPVTGKFVPASGGNRARV